MQKEWPQVRVVGWAMSSRQIVHANASPYRQASSIRGGITLRWRLLSRRLSSKREARCFLMCAREIGFNFS